jgi:hypothetical protein
MVAQMPRGNTRENVHAARFGAADDEPDDLAVIEIVRLGRCGLANYCNDKHRSDIGCPREGAFAEPHAALPAPRF